MLISPDTGEALQRREDAYETANGARRYPIVDGMALLFSQELEAVYRRSTDTVQEYYRNVAQVYGRSHHVALPGARAFLALLEAKLARFIQPEHTVLEIGAGTGFATNVVMKLNPAPVLADASLEMLRVNLDAHPELTAVCCPTERLPFADASFDVVFGNNTFYLVPDKERAAREIARVLKPGGVLLLSEMNPHHPLWPLMFTLKRRWFERSFYALFPGMMRRRFARAGMQLEEHDFYSYTPYFAGETLLAGLAGVERAIGWSKSLRRFSAIRVFYALRKPS
jgi:ubiquinone/menaquinone biosynthesis C-methylase UbiE